MVELIATTGQKRLRQQARESFFIRVPSAYALGQPLPPRWGWSFVGPAFSSAKGSWSAAESVPLNVPSRAPLLREGSAPLLYGQAWSDEGFRDRALDCPCRVETANVLRRRDGQWRLRSARVIQMPPSISFRSL